VRRSLTSQPTPHRSGCPEGVCIRDPLRPGLSGLPPGTGQLRARTPAAPAASSVATRQASVGRSPTRRGIH
jgi:hypothetical protein